MRALDDLIITVATPASLLDFDPHGGDKDVAAMSREDRHVIFDLVDTYAANNRVRVYFAHHIPGLYSGSSFWAPDYAAPYVRDYVSGQVTKVGNGFGRMVVVFTDLVPSSQFIPTLAHELGHMQSYFDGLGEATHQYYAKIPRCSFFRNELTNFDKDQILKEEERAWVNGSFMLAHVLGGRDPGRLWTDFHDLRTFAMNTYYSLETVDDWARRERAYAEEAFLNRAKSLFFDDMKVLTKDIIGQTIGHLDEEITDGFKAAVKKCEQLIVEAMERSVMGK